MELHSLLGNRPGSTPIRLALAEASHRSGKGADAPAPVIKVYSDAVYHSYLPLGISLDYKPCTPLNPSLYKSGDAPPPEPSLLMLVAIHLYNNPVDKFDTFPLSFVITRKRGKDGATASEDENEERKIEMDLSKRAYEIVQLLGEPEQKVGGGRQGNCWIGYQTSAGLAVDFAGNNWDDRDMRIASLTLTAPGWQEK
ncbi:hypothetical protein EDD11_004805 [Mortierella claussenii]|nr:hypothetical protein EDD11_004805 [Mortierella claussenii]